MAPITLQIEEDEEAKEFTSRREVEEVVEIKRHTRLKILMLGLKEVMLGEETIVEYNTSRRTINRRQILSKA
jgi:hypothetical protein